MIEPIRHFRRCLPGSRLRFAAGLACLAQVVGSPWCVAAPVTGSNVFTRPLNDGVAISVQAILSADADTAQIPIFVGPVDTRSSAGATVSRTNDWLYYQLPATLVATDSFQYVVTNLLQQAATGTVTIVASGGFVATNFLTISNLAPGWMQIQFHGDVGSYNLERSSNLQAWQTIAARLAWPTGYFQFRDDAAGPGQPENFYRAANGALAPAITNYQAAGTANVQVDFNLGAEGGVHSPYLATIESLPARGYLFQDDGSVISNVPAPVTGANGSLHYFGRASGAGTNYASFQYKLTRPADGLDSLPATFQLSLAPDVPVVIPPSSLNLPEDIGGLIQLTGNDPDLRYSSNHLQFEVIFSPSIGNLYQVNQDGTTDWSNVIQDFTYVSNTNGWVYYQPDALQYGSPFDSTTVLAQNSFNVQSAVQEILINVYFVNHPPTASDAVVSGSVDQEPLQPLNGLPYYYDPDFNASTICFASLPARGYLYVSYGTAPGNLVTASNNCFPLGSGPTLNFYSDSYTNGTPCYPDGADIGSPYATATYFITDSYGATSSTNLITFNVTPLPEPISIPSGPTDYTNLLNQTNTIVFTATNSAGPVNDVLVDLRTVPTHGQLYLSNGRPITATDVPTYLPPNPVLVYKPNSGYYSSRDGLDSFDYRLMTLYDETRCDTVINLHVLAPPIFTFSSSSATVTLDTNGVTLVPAVINNLPITARDAATNAILQLTVTASPSGSAPYAYFTLNSTNGLTRFITNAPTSIQLQGTLGSLASVIAAGINYYSTPTSIGGVTCVLNDLGTTGVGTNTSTEPVTVFYYCPGCVLSN